MHHRNPACLSNVGQCCCLFLLLFCAFFFQQVTIHITLWPFCVTWMCQRKKSATCTITMLHVDLVLFCEKKSATCTITLLHVGLVLFCFRGKYVIDLMMTLTAALNVPEKQILLMKHWSAPSKNTRFGSNTTLNRDGEVGPILYKRIIYIWK